jgi:hypothetical protein
MDEPFTFRFPSSGAERLVQHHFPQQQTRHQQGRQRDQNRHNLSMANLIRIKPGERKMRIDKLSPAVHCSSSKTIEQFSHISDIRGFDPANA